MWTGWKRGARWSVIEVGQLRRWTHDEIPTGLDWNGRIFLVIEEKVRWIDGKGKCYSSWRFLMDGVAEGPWRGEDLESVSEVLR